MNTQLSPGTGNGQEACRLRREHPEFTLQKIADLLGCTKENVRLILKRKGLPTRGQRPEKPVPPARPCAGCGKPLRDGQEEHCSIRCAQQPLRQPRSCSGCGNTFTPSQHQVRSLWLEPTSPVFCSKSCSGQWLGSKGWSQRVDPPNLPQADRQHHNTMAFRAKVDIRKMGETTALRCFQQNPRHRRREKCDSLLHQEKCLEAALNRAVRTTTNTIQWEGQPGFTMAEFPDGSILTLRLSHNPAHTVIRVSKRGSVNNRRSRETLDQLEESGLCRRTNPQDLPGTLGENPGERSSRLREEANRILLQDPEISGPRAARLLGCSNSTAHRLLRELRPTADGPNPPRWKGDNEELTELRLAHPEHTLGELARNLGCSVSQVYRKLRALGLPTRAGEPRQ